MPKHISRRKALAAGTVSAGALFATACSKPEQKTPVKAIRLAQKRMKEVMK